MSAGGLISRSWTLKKLEYSLDKADCYSTWKALAAEHDELSGANQWKQSEDSDLFDARQLKKRFKVLQDALAENDREEVLFALNEGIHGNMGGMGKSVLYRQSRLGTKKLIENYVATVVEALQQVGDAPESEIPFDEKLDFFRRASHCYGRSALTLSGGGGLIYFHHGVVETLLEHNILPNVISGASAGAWMAAQIGTRTDAELSEYFQHKRYDFQAGKGLKDIVGLMRGIGRADLENERDDVIDAFVPNLTFQEAYERTGRYINISIAPVEKHQTSRLMNAITSPNVTIRSAVKASSSVPGLVDPVELEAKDSRGRTKPYLRSRRWVDGSFAEDLPFKRLARLFGVNHYVVSMINPLAAPFLRPESKSGSLSVTNSVKNLAIVGARETLKTGRRWISPVTLGRFDSMFGVVYQLIEQDYVGDINIVLNRKQVKSGNSLFNYADDADIQALILAGRRATWPRVDQIRNSVQISRAIDEILDRLEQEALAQPHPQHKPHMTL
ncbi:DUF3336 domain-containing protein [Pseudomaricurvus alcaniphilus]|uniref:DUF3336 domain-containing protein n=1 Tax=Pseudomaricurvus alcaniphilus TaxID=1166482 RepID=UPI00140848B5|nr:DUF3336 domain-containing protein [Pseudomaricurvus alcaniphilus]NHN39346.1 DUF3336 domain-containing protein [Pseudomaricurvus alcaniphilus]